MATLRDIDFAKKYFECDGRKFYVRDSLSFARYRELQKISLEFGFSSTFHDMYKNVRTAWDLLNQTKLGEAAVVLYNIMSGVVQTEEKDVPAWRLCALFIDEEGEDPTVYDEGKMREKIECWGKELSAFPFFQLAANLAPGWMNVYNGNIQSGSEEAASKEVIS